MARKSRGPEKIKGTPEWLRLQRAVEHEILWEQIRRNYRLLVETVTVSGHEPRRINAVVYRHTTPLLQERPVAARNLNSGWVLNCAYDLRAYRIRYRGQLGVLLRPIRRADTLELAAEDIVDSNDYRDYPRQRTEAIKQILGGQRTRALIRVEQTLMACLAPIPPGDPRHEPQLLEPAEVAALVELRRADPRTHRLRVVTQDEATLLEELRAKDLPPERVRRLLRDVLAENDSDT